MNIAFYSDDRMATHAALLAHSALDRLHGGSIGLVAGKGGEAVSITAHLDSARKHQGHVMLSLPLAQFGNAAIRERLDLAVVTSGSDPLARQAAERAMASASAQGTGHTPPAWLLRGAASHPGPDGIRSLPVTMKALSLEEVASLRAGCSCGPLHRRAVALAATLRVVADDPFAVGLELADFARVIAGGTLEAGATAAEMALRADLLDLVADLDDDEEPAPTTSRMVIADPQRRSRRPRDRHPNRTMLRAPAFMRHAKGCAYVSSL